MFRRASLLAALLAASLALAACGGGSQQSSSAPAPSSTSTSAPAETGGEVQRIEVAMVDFLFEPDQITVRQGTPVEIVLTNRGTVEHNFVVDGLDVDSGKVGAGQSTTLRFTPGQAGEFRIVCTEAGHEVLGMVGTLVVQ